MIVEGVWRFVSSKVKTEIFLDVEKKLLMHENWKFFNSLTKWQSHERITKIFFSNLFLSSSSTHSYKPYDVSIALILRTVKMFFCSHLLLSSANKIVNIWEKILDCLWPMKTMKMFCFSLTSIITLITNYNSFVYNYLSFTRTERSCIWSFNSTLNFSVDD